LLVIALKECADMTVLWTAVNVNAVREAALRIDHLLKDADDETKKYYVRFLSSREEPRCSVDVAFSQRRQTIGSVLQQKVVLMTEDGFLMEHTFAYTQMHILADISLKDEAQQGGTPAHAFQLAFLHPNGIAVNVGDPSQTKLAVDSRNVAMKKLVRQIEERDPGIRCRSLNWVPANDWSLKTCEFLCLDYNQSDSDDLGPLSAILENIVNGNVIHPLTSADMAALRISAPPQLTVAMSYRLSAFTYCLVVAAGYDHLVTYQDSDDGISCSIRLGELTGPSHNSCEHVLSHWAQMVWIQPWGWSLSASLESHFDSVLAMLIHMCMQRKSEYYTHLQLGVVISRRTLAQMVVSHFEKNQPDFFADLALSQASTFTPDLNLSMLANIAAVCGKSCVSVTEDDVIRVFTKSPWVVRDFVGITTSMSAVGSEKLDVLFYKLSPGAFVDKEDQNIVAYSRHKGHLYCYCDMNRVRGFAARIAAMVVRCCPIVYWSARDIYSVKDRLSLFLPASVSSDVTAPSQPAPSSAADASIVVRLLEIASDAWDTIPLCIAVHLTKDNTDEVRLLYARPYTPPDRNACSVPWAFWLNDWTSWSWESLEWDTQTDHWSLRPRWPTWKLRIGKENVAVLNHATAMGSKSFQMHAIAGRRCSAVHVAIMPAYVFPTHTRWTSSDIIKLMLRLRKVSAPPGLTDICPHSVLALVDVSDDESSEADFDDSNSQADSFLSGSNADDLGVAAFSEAAMNAHGRAIEVWQSLVQDPSLIIDPDDCHTVYYGLSPELPWTLLTFDFQSLTKPFFLAKLAKIYAVSCAEHGQELSKPIDIRRIVSSVHDDLLRNHVLFDTLAKFFSDLLRLLPAEPPLWWEEVVTILQWDRYKSINFIKHQLCRAFENMHNDSFATDDRSMFVASRTTSHGVRQRVPAYIRLVLPRGMALCLHARLRAFQRQSHRPEFNHLCFDLKNAGDGESIGLELKPTWADQCLNVYRSKFIHEFLRLGVTQNVCQEIGGCTRFSIKLMKLVYDAVDKNRLVHSTQLASAANCNCLRRMFVDYVAARRDVDDISASRLLGPTSHDIEIFLSTLEKARAQPQHYKDKQHRSIDFNAYITNGMKLDLLTTAKYKVYKRPGPVSNYSGLKRQGN